MLQKHFLKNGMHTSLPYKCVVKQNSRISVCSLCYPLKFGIIVHLNSILSCRLRLWNDLIILVNKHDCSGCEPDLIGESLLNK